MAVSVSMSVVRFSIDESLSDLPPDSVSDDSVLHVAAEETLLGVRDSVLN